MNHDEYDEKNWRDEKDDWVDYVKYDVLCTAFSYARFSKSKLKIFGFVMKDCLSSPGSGWKHFSSVKTEEDEPICTYNDKYIRWFVQQSIRRGRVCVFIQYYKSIICDGILKIISEELNVERIIYDFVEAN